MGNMEELAAVYKSLDLSKAISHHGVKGQKWGVRNGPPYPLDSSISTGKRLKKSGDGRKVGSPDKDSKSGKVNADKIIEEYPESFMNERPYKERIADSKYPHLTAENIYEQALSGEYSSEEELADYIVKNKDYFEKNHKDLYNDAKRCLADNPKRKPDPDLPMRIDDDVDLIDERNEGKHERFEDSTTLGMKALNKVRQYDDVDPSNKDDREWFVWEDQTIGYLTIADLANQGYNKQQILFLMDRASEKYWDGDDEDQASTGIFQLNEARYASLYDYIDACIEIKKEDSKSLKHHGVQGQKWGVRNGPPYPLKDGGSSRKIGEKKPGVFKRAFTALDERRKKRKKDKMASSMKKLYKNRKKFTPEEIEERIKMFDLEQKIVDRKNTELDRPRKFINIMLGYGKSLKEAYKLINPDSGGGGGNNNNNNNNNNNDNNQKKKDKPQRKSFQDQWLENIKKEEKMINARLALRQAKDREKDYKKKRKSMKHSDEVSVFLAHHGVQGQKWGVRNGPPYPLDSSISTGNKLKKSGGSSKGDNKKPDEKKRKEGLTILIPASINPLAPLAVYAGAAAVMFGAALTNKMLRKHGKKKFDTEYETNTTVDKKSGLKKKPREMTEKEDLKRVNPDYGTSWNIKESAKSSNNCTNCTYAYELRRRGFDVRAGHLSVGRSDTETVTKALFKGATFNKKYAKEPKDVTFADELKAQKGFNFSLYENVKAELEKQPKGSRGQLIVHWDAYSGHSVNYVINDKGKVEIHEAQLGKKKNISEYLTHAVDAKWARLDDKQANYSQFKKKGVIR